MTKKQIEDSISKIAFLQKKAAPATPGKYGNLVIGLLHKLLGKGAYTPYTIPPRTDVWSSIRKGYGHLNDPVNTWRVGPKPVFLGTTGTGIVALPTIYGLSNVNLNDIEDTPILGGNSKGTDSSDAKELAIYSGGGALLGVGVGRVLNKLRDKPSDLKSDVVSALVGAAAGAGIKSL